MSVTKPTEPRYARIAEEIRQRIVKGSWGPGFLLPKETDLAVSYGVSRMTMNKVLTELSKEGFLLRRKRSGTVVAQPRAQSAVMEINDIAQEVAALGLSYEWRLFSSQQRVLDASETHLLDLDANARAGTLLLLTGVHLAANNPFCIEMRAIHTEIVPAALTADFKVNVPGQWLLKSMPFTTASHRIRAVNAAGQDAKILAAPAGAACLEILRKTKIDQDWVTHVRLLYPGERHQLVADFAP